jgi:hypothetical protein
MPTIILSAFLIILFGRQMSSLALLLVVMVNSPWLAIVPARTVVPAEVRVTVAPELVAVTAAIVALLKLPCLMVPRVLRII